MTDTESTQTNRSNRRVLLGIFGIPIVVFVLSTALYYLVVNDVIQLGTVNNGELVTPPLKLADVALTHVDSSVFEFESGEPLWTFLVIGDERCEDSCARMLYLARQSIVALGKKMNRVRLAYLTPAEVIDPALQARIDREYRGIELLHMPAGQLQALFAEAGAQPMQPRTFFVVDPQGWLMMFYQAEDTEQDTLNSLGKAVVRDMKRLLK